jgi:hypothetical protein
MADLHTLRAVPAGGACPACGAPSHPQANYCAACGEPLRGGPRRGAERWEYDDLVVRIDAPPDSPRFVGLVDARVLEALQTVGEDGWEAAGPTDWPTLEELQRYTWTRGGRWLDRKPYVRTVRIRVRRAVPV